MHSCYLGQTHKGERGRGVSRFPAGGGRSPTKMIKVVEQESSMKIWSMGFGHDGRRLDISPAVEFVLDYGLEGLADK